MFIDKGDYLIARTSEKKKALCKAKTSGDSKDKLIKVVVANEFSETPEAETYELDAAEILAVLGKNPSEGGNIYGVRVEPWREKFIVKGWGEVQVFRYMEDKEKVLLRKRLFKCGMRLRKHKLGDFIPTCQVKVFPKRGRWEGHYAFLHDGLDILALHPKEWHDLAYLIYHEAGHGVWYRQMPDSWKARWVRMYHRCVRLQEANPKEVERLAKEFCASEMTVKEFKGEQGEDSLALFAEMLDWIEAKHHLTSNHLDIMISGGIELKTLFPDRKLLLSDVETVISDYAATKPEEFWAEAFSYYLLKKELPVGVQKLMQKTLTKIAVK